MKPGQEGNISDNITQQTNNQMKSKIEHDQEQYEAWSKYKGKSRD